MEKIDLGKIEKNKINGEDYGIKVPKPLGYLYHEPTGTKIAVFSKIGKLQRVMIKYFFGLKYIKL